MLGRWRKKADGQWVRGVSLHVPTGQKFLQIPRLNRLKMARKQDFTGVSEGVFRQEFPVFFGV